MIRERAAIKTGSIKTGSSSPGHRNASGVADFTKGFVEGFGSVGCVFRIVQPTPRKKSLAMKLAQATGAERKAILRMKKREIMAKYVGKATASKLLSASSEMQEGHTRRVDAVMLHRDFVQAVSKVHG